MFTPEPAKHYKHIHWTWGQHIHSCSFSSLLKPDNSSLTEVIDHCTIDFHWVRHRILRQIGFVSESIRTILPNVLTALNSTRILFEAYTQCTQTSSGSNGVKNQGLLQVSLPWA